LVRSSPSLDLLSTFYSLTLSLLAALDAIGERTFRTAKRFSIHFGQLAFSLSLILQTGRAPKPISFEKRWRKPTWSLATSLPINWSSFEILLRRLVLSRITRRRSGSKLVYLSFHLNDHCPDEFLEQAGESFVVCDAAELGVSIVSGFPFL